MTIHEAILAVRQVGSIVADAGRITLQIPPAAKAELGPAIETLRLDRTATIAALESVDFGEAEIDHALTVVNRRGVRIMALADDVTIGVWSDLDGREIRAALRVLEMDQRPVRYLDGAGIPIRYKARRVAGEAVPLNVLAEMEANPEQPWLVRDRLFKQGEKSK